MEWTTGEIKTNRPHVEGIEEGLEKAGGPQVDEHTVKKLVFSSRILRVMRRTRFTHILRTVKSPNTHLQHRPFHTVAVY